MWLPFAGGCSLFDPKVGPTQAACEDQSGSATGSPYGATVVASGTCWADAGSDCDDCESTHCCQTRLTCYGDPVCDCADKALDTCLEPLTSGPTSDGSDPATQCWNAFNASGHIAQARTACERAWCQQVCAVP